MSTIHNETNSKVYCKMNIEEQQNILLIHYILFCKLKIYNTLSGLNSTEIMNSHLLDTDEE